MIIKRVNVEFVSGMWNLNNFVLKISDEIAKQLLNSGAKLIISIPEIHSILQAAVAQTKKPIKIISIKTSESQSLPADAINFYELIRTNG